MFEKGGAEVEDEVYAGPLLHHLEGCAEDGAAEITLLMPEATLEAIEPAAEIASLRDDLKFVLVISDDFREFGLDVFGVAGLASKTAEDLSGAVDFAAFDEVAGGFGEEEEAEGEDEGPEHLDGHGDAVGAAVGVVLGAVVDAGGEEEADCDAELVAGDDGAAYFLGGDFGHVEDDDGGDEADAETGDETAGDEEAVGG